MRYALGLSLAPNAVGVALSAFGHATRFQSTRRSLFGAESPSELLGVAWTTVCDILARWDARPETITSVALSLAGHTDASGRPSGGAWPAAWQGADIVGWARTQFGCEVTCITGLDLILRRVTPSQREETSLVVWIDDELVAALGPQRIRLGQMTPGLLALSLPPARPSLADLVTSTALLSRWQLAQMSRQAARDRAREQFGESSRSDSLANRVTPKSSDELLSLAVRDDELARAIVSDAAVAIAWGCAQLQACLPGYREIVLAGPLTDLPPELFLDPVRRIVHDWLAITAGPVVRVTALPRGRDALLEELVEVALLRTMTGLRVHDAGAAE
jgi:hypothetical protein